MEQREDIYNYTLDICSNIENFIDLTMEHLNGLSKLPSKMNHLIEYEIKSIEEKLVKLFARQYLATKEYFKLYPNDDNKENGLLKYPSVLKFTRICFDINLILSQNFTDNLTYEKLLSFNEDDLKGLFLPDQTNLEKIKHFLKLIRITNIYIDKKRNLYSNIKVQHQSQNILSNLKEEKIIDKDAVSIDKPEIVQDLNIVLKDKDIGSIKASNDFPNTKDKSLLYLFLKNCHAKFSSKSLSFTNGNIDTATSKESDTSFKKFGIGRNSLSRMIKKTLPHKTSSNKQPSPDKSSKNSEIHGLSEQTFKTSDKPIMTEKFKGDDTPLLQHPSNLKENQFLSLDNPPTIANESNYSMNNPKSSIRSNLSSEEKLLNRLNRFPPRHKYIPVVKVNFLCSHCSRPMWIGLKCKICKIKCHSKCVEYLPKFCSIDLILLRGNLLDEIKPAEKMGAITSFDDTGSTVAGVGKDAGGGGSNSLKSQQLFLYNNLARKNQRLGIRKSLSSSCLLPFVTSSSSKFPVTHFLLRDLHTTPRNSIGSNTTRAIKTLENPVLTADVSSCHKERQRRRRSKDDIDLEMAKAGDWSNYKTLLPLNDSYALRKLSLTAAHAASSSPYEVRKNLDFYNSSHHPATQIVFDAGIRPYLNISTADVATTTSSPTLNSTSIYSSPSAATTAALLNGNFGGTTTPSLIFNYDSILKNGPFASTLLNDNTHNGVLSSDQNKMLSSMFPKKKSLEQVNDLLNISQISSSSFGERRSSVSPPNSKSSRGSPSKEDDNTSLLPTNFDEFRTQWTKSLPNSLKEWNIPYDQIEIRECIGTGWQSKVYRGYWHGKIAIKILKLDEDLWSPVNKVEEENELNHKDKIDQNSQPKGNPSHSQFDRLEDTLPQNSHFDKNQLDYQAKLRKYKRYLDAFRHEISILRKTRHQNLVLFMGASIKPPIFAIITSFIKGISLFQHIHIIGTRFSLEKIIYISTQIAQGMGYLHAKGILHKDLRSKNIFIESGRVVISDFGIFCAVKISDTGKRHSNYLSIPAGWIYYLAPEIMRCLRAIPQDSSEEIHLPFTCSTDVFAFGTLLFELMSGEFPFSEFPTESIIWQMGSGLLPSLIYAHVSYVNYHQYHHTPSNAAVASVVNPSNASAASSTTNGSVLISSNFHFKTLKLLLYSYCWSYTPQSRVSFAQVSKALEGIKPSPHHLLVANTQSYNLSSAVANATPSSAGAITASGGGVTAFSPDLSLPSDSYCPASALLPQDQYYNYYSLHENNATSTIRSKHPFITLPENRPLNLQYNMPIKSLESMF